MSRSLTWPAWGLSRSRQSGLSLVELMVAMVISLLILAALVALFTNTSRSNREFARANSMIESGRLAVQVLEADVVHAGFWGTFVAAFDDQTASGVPVDTPTLCRIPASRTTRRTGNAAYVNSLIGVPVEAYDDATVCPGIITNRLPGTDVLVVRHVENCVPGVGNCDAAVAGRLYFQARCATRPRRVPVRRRSRGIRPVPSAIASRRPTSAASCRRSTSPRLSETPGDGIPTLMRSEFDFAGGALAQQPAVPLIEGSRASAWSSASTT
jgi:type IV pilus assembly protein PilW